MRPKAPKEKQFKWTSFYFLNSLCIKRPTPTIDVNLFNNRIGVLKILKKERDLPELQPTSIQNKTKIYLKHTTHEDKLTTPKQNILENECETDD